MECLNSMVNQSLAAEVERDERERNEKHKGTGGYTQEESDYLHSVLQNEYLFQRQSINGDSLFLHGHERPGINKRVFPVRARRSGQIYDVTMTKPIDHFLEVAKTMPSNSVVFIVGNSFRNMPARQRVIAGLDQLGLSHEISDELWQTAQIK